MPDNTVRTFFSLLKRRLRRRESAAGGRKRPSSPRPSAKNGRLVQQMRQCGSPVPLTFECSINARRVKGASASLRDRTSSTLDPPTADQVRGSYQGDGAAVVTSFVLAEPLMRSLPRGAQCHTDG